MSYLFVDNWSDFSDLNDSSRGITASPIFQMYASVLRAHGKIIYYINANDSKITRKGLIDFVKVEKIKTIVFQSDIDNINSILHLDLLNTIDKMDLILLSINENLIHLTKKQGVKSIMYNERLSFEDNFLVFLNELNIEPDFQCIKKNVIDYSIMGKDFRRKTAIINIGRGCKAKCSFCNIADSEIEDRPLEIVMQEITSLLDLGIKFFHVENHNFSCNRNFIKDFCAKLKDLLSHYDFAWSCFVIPGFFIDNIDLLPLMAKSNLKKLEIGCETGCEVLLSGMNIEHLNANVEEIITASISQNIHIFSVHFILGTLKENVKSLDETKDFILKLIDLTTTFCDIHLHCYFPEKDCFENIFYEITNKRTDFVCGSESLTIEELNEHRKQIYIAIKLKRNELKNNICLQKQHILFMLEKKYDIVSQIGRDYFSKTRNYSLFTNKETHEHVFYSWEISKNVNDYSLVYNNFGTFVPQEKLNADYSNFHTVLDNYIRSGYTRKEIIDTIYKEANGKITIENVCSMLEQLENQYGLYYIKYLK